MVGLIAYENVHLTAMKANIEKAKSRFGIKIAALLVVAGMKVDVATLAGEDEVVTELPKEVAADELELLDDA